MDELARRLVDTFCELASIDSVTFEEGEIADDLESRLRSLGLETWRDDADQTTQSESGNLFGRLAGRPELPGMVFMAHMDTVEPGRGVRPVVEGDVIRSASDTILGADDKAAIAIILEALRTLIEEEHPRGDVFAIFTVAEEKGLIGAKALDLSRVEAEHCFVLDSHKDVGHAIVAAPWQNTIRARVHGKAAHAGVCPSEGVNAIVCAAKAVARMTLGQVDDETTANIGRIEGGRATNVVPDLVELAGEARSHDRAKLESQTEAMAEALRAASEGGGCRVEIDVVDEYHGFAFEGGEPIVRLFEDACARLGREPCLECSNGGSDANVLNDAGIPALVLSTGMESVHSTDESVRVGQLVAGHDVVVALVDEARSA